MCLQLIYVKVFNKYIVFSIYYFVLFLLLINSEDFEVEGSWANSLYGEPEIITQI